MPRPPRPTSHRARRAQSPPRPAKDLRPALTSRAESRPNHAPVHSQVTAGARTEAAAPAPQPLAAADAKPNASRPSTPAAAR